MYFVPLQSANVLQSVDTIYYASTVMNTSHLGRPLMITENNLTTMTSLEYSLISSTKGGGAAHVNLGGEGADIDWHCLGRRWAGCHVYSVSHMFALSVML